jgi:hypothetical protein
LAAAEVRRGVDVRIWAVLSHRTTAIHVGKARPSVPLHSSSEACLIELLRWLNASWVLVGDAGTGRSSPYCRTSPSTRARCCTGRTAARVCTCRMISCGRWPERGSRRGRGLCRPADPGMAHGRWRRHSPGPPSPRVTRRAAGARDHARSTSVCGASTSRTPGCL